MGDHGDSYFNDAAYLASLDDPSDDRDITHKSFRTRPKLKRPPEPWNPPTPDRERIEHLRAAHNRKLAAQNLQAPWMTPAPEPEPETRKTNTMKSKRELGNIAAMLSDQVVSVEATFLPEDLRGKRYTYKCPVDLARTLTVGDTVVASSADPSEHKFQVVHVADIHGECILDDAANRGYGWICNKVDKRALAAALDWEQKAAERLHAGQRARARASVLEELGASDFATDLPRLSHTTTESDVDDAEVIET